MTAGPGWRPRPPAHDRARVAFQLRKRDPSWPADRPEDVICCGHDLAVHDDDGCTVGWHAADSRAATDGCPCRVRGWAS